ncbi:flavin reductase family protein [Pseudonocardia aurantiaca]|uniref:Flavin reductase family protein n=1 Tax=Pseudonocardia aurantiaca TaxID=75290 RepID=A0ABW4FKI2_9PSEU
MSATVGSADTVDATDPVVDGAVMRDVLGHFASGVVVVTANGPSGPMGFTCQSFTSLSLDPPLVSFAPSRTSSTWPRIRDAETFCVNILAADQEHHSAGFARSGVDNFTGVRWRPGRSGAPILEGACAWVHCRLHSEHDGGDHTIVVGRVLELAADHSRRPLLYHRGNYGLVLPRPREEVR